MIPLGVLASRRAATGAVSPEFRGGQKVNFSANATATYASAPLGPAGTARTVIVAAASRCSQVERKHTGCTIGGITAAKDSAPATTHAEGSIWRATVPIGTNADIVIYGDGTPAYYETEISVYTFDDALTVTSTASSATSPTLTTTAGGFYIATAAVGRLSVITVTDTNFTSEDYGVNHMTGSGPTTGANVSLTASPLTSGSITAVAYAPA